MADGKITFDTAVDQSGMKKDLAGIKNSAGGLKKTLGKIAGMVAAAFSVRAVTRFGKACIELGSDLAEVQNVVDVTFASMSDQVDEFAQKAMYTAGLSETMSKKFIGTFGSMAKSFGFTEDQAFSMSRALTQMSGDVASFYNITQDEAYTKLKSVFTGETESLKDLGVVMTQAALDQYAMANGYGKTTKAMTEAEKVALRYAFVMDKLSGASGDFMRTSDGWANQTRMLSLQFQQLKATIGQGLIPVLTPVLQFINAIIRRLQALAVAFRDFIGKLFGRKSGGGGFQVDPGPIEDTKAGMEGAADAAEGMAGGLESVGQAAKEAKRELAGFDEITRIGSKDMDALKVPKPGDLDGGAGDIWIPDILPPDLEQQYTVFDEILDRISAKLQALIAPLKEIDFTPLKESLKDLWEAVKPLLQTIGTHMEWIWFNILAPFVQWLAEEAVPAVIDVISAVVSFITQGIDLLCGAFEALWPYLKPVVDFFEKQFVKAMKSAQKSWEKFAKAIGESKDDFKNIFDEIGRLFKGLWDFVEPILDSASSTISFQLDFIRGAVADAMKAVIRGISGALTLIRGLMTGDWSAIWDGAKDILGAAVYLMIDMMAHLATAFGVDFDTARQAIINAINGVIGGINWMVQGITAGLNWISQMINSLTFKVPDWIPYYGGAYWSPNLPTFTPPQIPYLAQGAVLPPNKPFMAMVGDQRHGTNIEAPLETIKQAVAEVIGRGRDDEIIELLQAILSRCGVYLDGRDISRMVSKYQREEARARG